MPVKKQETEILDAADDAAEMQEQLERSTQAMEQLQDALTQERETSAGLREELAAVQSGGGRQGKGLRWFFAEIWSYPQFRMLLVALVVAVWLAGSEKLGAGNLAFAVFAVLLFCKWAEGVYRKLGPGQLVLKCIAAILGLVVVFASFFGGNQPEVAFPVLVLVALLVMSKATERLAESDMALVRFVREWF
jgi:hypothetical protein